MPTYLQTSIVTDLCLLWGPFIMSSWSAFWEPLETNFITSLLLVGRKSTWQRALPLRALHLFLPLFWRIFEFRRALKYPWAYQITLKIPHILIHMYLLSSNHEDWKSYLRYPDFLEEERDCWIDAIEHQEGTTLPSYCRAVGRSENLELPVSFSGHNLPPALVEIGLTDLAKSGGFRHPWGRQACIGSCQCQYGLMMFSPYR